MPSKKFMFLSEARKFQRKKRAAGYKTKIKHHLGIGFPFRTVTYTKK